MLAFARLSFTRTDGKDNKGDKKMDAFKDIYAVWWEKTLASCLDKKLDVIKDNFVLAWCKANSDGKKRGSRKNG